MLSIEKKIQKNNIKVEGKKRRFGFVRYRFR